MISDEDKNRVRAATDLVALVQETVELLLERALKKGGRDNATMVLCEIREPEKTWFHKMLDRMHKRDEGDEK